MKKWVLTLAILTSYWYGYTQHTATAEDRRALFDYIIEKTKIREAWSPIKEQKLGFNPIEDMMALKEEFIAADTDEKLFYTLQKLSAARRDRHLSVRTVDGGLKLPEMSKSTAPIRFSPDFSDKDNLFLFVSDLGKDIASYTSVTPKVGDELVRINGEEIKSYLQRAIVYTQHSTYENYVVKMGQNLAVKDSKLPPWFYKEKLNLTLKPKNGKEYSIALPYLQKVNWEHGIFRRNYKGYKKVNTFDFDSFELYQSTNKSNKTLLLWWYGFRRDLPEASDALVAWAEKNNKLDHHLIIDAVDSRGGSQGAYALARLSPKAFKTTGGNLKLSDITYDFVSNYTQKYLQRKTLMDHDSKETEDDGTWVVDWLNGPVLKGLAAGQDYSNNTPFKCAHLPHYSDWMMKPAQKHFKGKMVVFFGPSGGSHLSQFAAMIRDNTLGYTLGMPDGGYSNTWEWTEILKFPGTNQSIASFMWNIGHTIRPNGQILEGNPAMVDEYIPQRRDNYLEYKNLLLDRALQYLQDQ